MKSNILIVSLAVARQHSNFSLLVHKVDQAAPGNKIFIVQVFTVLYKYIYLYIYIGNCGRVAVYSGLVSVLYGGNTNQVAGANFGYEKWHVIPANLHNTAARPILARERCNSIAGTSRNLFKFSETL